MAEGFLKSIDHSSEIISAGTKPETGVNPFAICVMHEIGIDISNQSPKSVTDFTNDSFDFVITVCDHAKEVCPVFTGHVKQQIHIGFADPADAIGTDEEILNVYRITRDQIRKEFTLWFNALKS
jgi:arsenate reductase (thioredoxin)